MENTNNLSSNGLDPRRLNDALERIDTLEDFIRVLKYVTPEALPRSGRKLPSFSGKYGRPDSVRRWRALARTGGPSPPLLRTEVRATGIRSLVLVLMLILDGLRYKLAAWRAANTAAALPLMGRDAYATAPTFDERARGAGLTFLFVFVPAALGILAARQSCS
jgi:hypothetical protein